MPHPEKSLSQSPMITATRVSNRIALGAARPAAEWERAEPVRFCTDWRGRNPDPAVETEVSVLWSPETLYLRFVCHYRDLFVFEDSDPTGRRDHLWDRDVAEAFLQPPDAASPRFYKEFEVSPNGMWIDLDISPGGLKDLESSLTRSVHLDRTNQIWSAELAIPMKSLTADFDAAKSWRANFYRVEGKAEPRRYMAWQPTHTPQPNFHVPSAFGELRFG
jgi:alpha-galactosidase